MTCSAHKARGAPCGQGFFGSCPTPARFYVSRDGEPSAVACDGHLPWLIQSKFPSGAVVVVIPS